MDGRCAIPHRHGPNSSVEHPMMPPTGEHAVVDMGWPAAVIGHDMMRF